MDKGVNGMLVVAVVAGGCIARDGRIVPGDYLLSVNNESLRNVTNSQARAILRRTQLLSTDIRYLSRTHYANWMNETLRVKFY